MKKIKNPIKTTGKDIKSLALLANKILTNETPYSITKNLIFKKLFQKKINMFDADVIRSRLIVIDATYSTNFNKRYYGFDDLIKHFKEFGKTDSELSNSFKEFLNETSNKLLDNEKLFGISKKGDVKGHGLSLISKYGYYLTKYKFPIYDSLAKEFLWKVNQNFDKNSIKKKDLSDCKKYFKIVQEVNDKLMIKDFDKLDNLLWLLGQINKGLFKSVISSKEKYQGLIKSLKVKDVNVKYTNQLKIKLIRKIKNNDVLEIRKYLSSDTIKFIKKANEYGFV